MTDLAIGATRPWSGISRQRSSIETGLNRYKEKFAAPVEELRKELRDGRRHDVSIAQEIAKRHDVSLTVLLDTAGVYRHANSIVYVRAIP